MVERADGVGLQKFSAKTFSGEHNRVGQASSLAEADSPVFFSRVVKVFLFLRKQRTLFSQVLLFDLFLALKKSKRCWWLALLVSRTGFKSLWRLCLKSSLPSGLSMFLFSSGTSWALELGVK